MFSRDFPFSVAWRIPALGDESTLLTLLEVYRRPRGHVNYRENRCSKSVLRRETTPPRLKEDRLPLPLITKYSGSTSRIGPRLPGKTGKAPAQRGKSSEKTSTGVDARPGEWKRRGTIDDRGTRLFVKETYKTTLVKVEPSEIFVDDLEDRSRHFVSCASILPSSCPP